jgi:hypothetical protein
MEDINNVTQPEFPEVTSACQPGTNPAPAPAPVKAKRAKAVAKLYYVTYGMQTEDDAHFTIVEGSEKGFRTKEEMAKFIRTLPPGEYTPISVPSKTVTVALATKVSIKGI